MAARYDFTIDQGSYWTRLITWKDADGDPIDLTGYTARLQWRKRYEDDAVLEITTENGGITLGGVDGTIQLDIFAGDTSPITINGDTATFLYDLEMIPGSESTAHRLLQGKFTLTREVTR